MLVGDKIGMHPVAVIFAILAGGELFGFTGVLLALPVAAVISGAGLAFAALGNGQTPVNVFWALGSLLGLNSILLLSWARLGSDGAWMPLLAERPAIEFAPLQQQQ